MAAPKADTGHPRPKVAVPHYAFIAGLVRDRLFLKYDGTPQRFQRACGGGPWGRILLVRFRRSALGERALAAEVRQVQQAGDEQAHAEG